MLSVRTLTCLFLLWSTTAFLPVSGSADPVSGNQYNLTVGALMPESAIIGEAIYLPAVQEAIDTCLARGYSRLSSHDRAGLLINTNGPSASYVILAFTRPNTPTSGDTISAPVIGIISQNEFPNHEVNTTVDCTVMTWIYNPTTEAIIGYSAEGAPGTPYAATDPSFTVASNPNESTYYWSVEDPVINAPSHFKKALGCFMLANAGYAAGSWIAGTACGVLTPLGCGIAWGLIEIGTAVGCALVTE